ncbi:MAG: 4Fe-4S binding protein [Syntrophales bacterium]|jgi:Fe-S-cluster-containing hydrogenase component 2|nr:4Fe-4S binding protein [Syntrophales bacterium]
MKIKRKIIQIDEEKCNGCGQCVPSCAEGAITIVDGKARLSAEKYCDGLGACLGECPQGALTIVEREAEDFDETAVVEHLEGKKLPASGESLTMACGCPSSQIQSFPLATSCAEANEPRLQASSASALTHWPVQISLVPPTAPFLKGADLLVAADCTPVAYPNFHSDFLQGKAVMLGCPKFDDAEAYVRKFAEIFKTAGIKSVTVLTMEVPCCQGLPGIVKKGMAAAGTVVPFRQVIISARGEIIEKK